MPPKRGGGGKGGASRGGGNGGGGGSGNGAANALEFLLTASDGFPRDGPCSEKPGAAPGSLKLVLVRPGAGGWASAPGGCS